VISAKIFVIAGDFAVKIGSKIAISD